MISHSFTLQPFVDNVETSKLTVGGDIFRSGDFLYLLFRVAGNIKMLKLPGQTAAPLRATALWDTTCFECFFRVAGDRGYHELNVAPDCNWNVYQFSCYRAGMQEQQAISSLSAETFIEDGTFMVRCTLPLEGCVQPNADLEVGLSCVLEHHDLKKSYWALIHSAAEPDFHHPDGFILTL